MRKNNLPTEQNTVGDLLRIVDRLSISEMVTAMGEMDIKSQRIVMERVNEPTECYFDNVEKDIIRAHFLANQIRAASISNERQARYEATEDLMYLFVRRWSEFKAKNARAIKVVECAKDQIAALVLLNDDKLTDAIVTGMLEHLFQEPGVAVFFADWDTRVGLAATYREASMLAGNSAPAVRRNKALDKKRRNKK